MANSPSSKSIKGNQKRKSSTKKGGSGSKTSAAKKQAAARAEWEYQRRRFMIAIVLFILSILFLLIYLMPGEKLWLSLHELYHGLFGIFGFTVPVIMTYCAYQNAKDEPSYYFKIKALLCSVLVMLLSTTVFCFGAGLGDEPLRGYAEELHNSLIYASTNAGPGVLGAMLGIPIVKIIGQTGGAIICILLFLILLTFTLDKFIINIFDLFKKPVKKIGEHMNDNKEIRKQVRQKEQERVAKERKQTREEYIQQQVDKKLAAKQKSSDRQLRKIKNTPFYEPDKGSTEPEITVPETETPKSKPKKKPAKKATTEVELPVFADDISITGVDYDVGELNFIPEQPAPPSPTPSPAESTRKNKKDPVDAFEITPDNSFISGQYIKPPFNILEPQPREEENNISMELNQRGTMLVDTLKSFSVPTTIVNISRGPSVTRYELQPASGVKISKITNLADDIAMNLAAAGVRIEAPIPGKSAVGIEVPNKHVSIVKMRNLVESDEFQSAKSNLTVALGKDITGKITLADLGKMPHLLIAGSTGSGKSVCINSMLVSLLYKSSPDDVKLMLIDPKVVELGVYNGIPHLLVPVVTDPRKAAGALNWAVNEMLNRYKIFAEYNVRDMHSYNRLVDRQNAKTHENNKNGIHIDDSERSFEEDEMLAQAQSELNENNFSEEEIAEPKQLKKMPQIVIVIDELADLMMAAPNEVEESICRLAQMARAAGMHLVIATQRPSVDVITGLIKANVPSRIAFAVKSQVDSRTILDSGGAEKLLGRGDMLFSPIGTTKPIRIQGCFVDDTEIENVIDFIKKNKVVEYDSDVLEQIEKNAIPESGGKGNSDPDAELDPLMEEAIKCVVEAGQASTSMLQRRFRVGYARAGRLIDEMEQIGIIGPHEGAKPRQVLMTYQQWMERNMARDE